MGTLVDRSAALGLLADGGNGRARGAQRPPDAPCLAPLQVQPVLGQSARGLRAQLIQSPGHKVQRAAQS